jgi:hypothetical protein
VHRRRHERQRRLVPDEVRRKRVRWLVIAASASALLLFVAWARDVRVFPARTARIHRGDITAYGVGSDPARVRCPTCLGYGRAAAYRFKWRTLVTCPTCDGRGDVPVSWFHRVEVVPDSQRSTYQQLHNFGPP